MKQHYKDLIVWQKAMMLVTELYRATRQFPNEEKYGLVIQMRRALLMQLSEVARLLNGLVNSLREQTDN